MIIKTDFEKASKSSEVKRANMEMINETKQRTKEKNIKEIIKINN